MLVELFDREFVEPQEAVGIRVLGQFRDIDRPDVFTWMRGFDNMTSRARALEAFYDGPVWLQHRDVANATMQTFDNVRLLRPLCVDDSCWSGRVRPGFDAGVIAPGLVVATIYTLRERPIAGFALWFDAELRPRLARAGAQPFATFETEPSTNTFPRLPVREGEHAFVCLARFASLGAYETHRHAVDAEMALVPQVGERLSEYFSAPPETWRLTPTARSRMIP